MVELYEKNNFSGFLADNEFLEEDMNGFYEKNKEKFDLFAKEHIKKINKLINS